MERERERERERDRERERACVHECVDVKNSHTFLHFSKVSNSARV